MLAFVAAAIISLLGLSLFTKLRSTPLYILAPLFLAVDIPCSIVFLVPIDLVSSSGHKTLFYLSEEVRLVLWRVVYWLAFCLTWLVLPVLQSFVDSGYHSVPQRLKDAGHRNLRYQLILLGSGVIGLVYVILTSGLSFGSIKALLIALSHSYALVIAIWLMGHGMVNMPRQFWVEADPNSVLKTLYRHATYSNDALAEVQTEYVNVAAEVFALNSYKDGPFQLWIEDMVNEVEAGPGVPLSANSESIQGQSRVRVDRAMIDEHYLSTLYSRFKTLRNRLVRADAEWQKLLYEASKKEDILRSSEDGSLTFRYKRIRFLPPKASYLFHTLLKPQIERALAIIFGVLTVVLVWSEITHGTVVSIVNLAVSGTNGILQQFLSTVFLGYMCVTALYSLSRIRVFKIYALVHRHSDYSSLLFYAMYACRLTVPLSFNYITLISSRDSIFEEFLGKSINLTPLGMYFNDWLPRFVLVPMAFTFFHVYDRIKDFLGFGFSFEDEDDNEQERGSVVEGRELVRRALSDPSYRYALRHPSVTSVEPSRQTSPRDSAQDIRSQLRPLQLGERHAPQNIGPQSQSQESEFGVNENDLGNKVKGFFSDLGGKIQTGLGNFRRNNNNGGGASDSSLLPRYDERRSTDYQDEDSEEDDLVV